MAVFGPRHRPLVIPAATIERIGAKLLTEGRVRRGYLGLGLQALRLDEALTQAHALSDRRGIMVVSLDPTGTLFWVPGWPPSQFMPRCHLPIAAV